MLRWLPLRSAVVRLRAAQPEPLEPMDRRTAYTNRITSLMRAHRRMANSDADLRSSENASSSRYVSSRSFVSRVIESPINVSSADPVR